MSVANVSLGYDAVCDLNGVPFGLTSLGLEVCWQVKDRTDTDATSMLCKKVPHRKVKISLTARRQSDVSLHAGPLSLTAGESIAVRAWAHGRGDASGLYDVPQLVVSSFKGDAQGASSQPQSVSLSGESNGDFFLPGE